MLDMIPLGWLGRKTSPQKQNTQQSLAWVTRSDKGPNDDHGFDPCWVRQHSFVEIDHEIFSKVIGYTFPSAYSRRTIVSFWQKIVHKYWLAA